MSSLYCQSVTALPKSCVSVVHISSAAKFQRFTETTLFAQFDKDVQSVKKMSLKFSTGNVFKPKYKLRVLRIRLTPVESTERYATFTVYLLILLPFCFRFSKYCSLWLHRPLCRYDLVLEESKEVTFRPIPCEEFNFWDQIWTPSWKVFSAGLVDSSLSLLRITQDCSKNILEE